MSSCTSEYPLIETDDAKPKTNDDKPETPKPKRQKLGNTAPEVVNEETASGPIGMEAYHLNAFVVTTRFKGMDVLDVMLEVGMLEIDFNAFCWS